MLFPELCAASDSKSICCCCFEFQHTCYSLAYQTTYCCSCCEFRSILKHRNGTKFSFLARASLSSLSLSLSHSDSYSYFCSLSHCACSQSIPVLHSWQSILVFHNSPLLALAQNSQIWESRSFGSDAVRFRLTQIMSLVLPLLSSTCSLCLWSPPQ